MSCRIGFDNLARRAEAPASASAGSTGTATPASRILSSRVNEVWRSAADVNSTWIEIALPEAGLIDTVCVPISNLTNSAHWRVRIGSGDLTNPGNVVFDGGTVPAGVIDPWALAVLYLATSVSGTKVRIDLQDGISSVIEVGRVWIGQSHKFDRFYAYGHELGSNDYSTVTRSPHGEVTVEERAQARAWGLSFEAASDVDKTAMMQMQRLIGMSREVLVCLDDQSTQLGADTALMIPTHVVTPKSRTHQLWSMSLNLEEIL